MKRNRTLYVSDLDGTLLGADSRVSNVTADIINRLITQYDIFFTVATSRTPATVVPLMAHIKCRLPFITMSGAALWNVEKGRLEQVEVIEPDVVEAVSDIIEHHGLHPFIYRNHHDTMIHTHHCGSLSNLERNFVAERSNLDLKRFILNDADYRHSEDDAMLIFSIGTHSVLEPIYKEIKNRVPCKAMYYHDAVNPEMALLEISRSGCSKAVAIKKLAKEIGASRIVAFGDNLNDLEMFRAAHHAIAVDNALPEVKAVAHEVISSNATDSVAHWLEEDMKNLGFHDQTV